MWKIAKTKESLMKCVGVFGAIALCLGVTAPGFASAAGTTPLRPTNFSGNCRDANDSWGELSLTFTPGSDGGSPITNYEYSLNNTTWTAFSPANTTQPFVFNFTALNLPPNTVSIYLRAVNANGPGESSWGNPTGSNSAGSCTMSNGLPAAPTTATATAGNGSASIEFTRGSNGGFPITNYKYSIDGGTTYTALSPASATSPMTITGLTNGVLTTIYLKAVNERGDSPNRKSVQVTPTGTPDTTRPVITSFSSTKADGTYGIGTTINITATISEDIAVGASITVTLDTGDTVVLTRATPTTLTGTYTVSAGDNSADLTVSSYVLTSAPTDASGNAMTSTALPTGTNNIAGAQAIVVDTTPPTLRSATANTAGTQVTLTFNEPLNATTAVASDFAVSVGATSKTVSSISVSGSTVILTLGTPAASGEVISVAYTAPTPNSATSNSAIQDIAGNDAISFTTTATVPSATTTTTTVAPAPAPAPEPEPTTTTTTTTTTTVAPTPTVAPTKASPPKVLECKIANKGTKYTAPVLVGEKLSEGIIFDPDSPILDSRDKRELDRVTSVMAERGGLVLVSGFARKNGFDSAEYLRNLSLKRARNVSNYLVAKGVRVSMRYEGYGAVTKDIGTSIERKVELRWIDDSEKIKYEKRCLNQ
jgi:outer membrane protein OmpA-like peptidoglycan-associated protein